MIKIQDLAGTMPEVLMKEAWSLIGVAIATV
jgi:hypothetical protein